LHLQPQPGLAVPVVAVAAAATAAADYSRWPVVRLLDYLHSGFVPSGHIFRESHGDASAQNDRKSQFRIYRT